MQDPMEQTYYMIAIGKYFILAKETKTCIIKTILRPLWVPWIKKKSTQLLCMEKKLLFVQYLITFCNAMNLLIPFQREIG